MTEAEKLDKILTNAANQNFLMDAGRVINATIRAVSIPGGLSDKDIILLKAIIDNGMKHSAPGKRADNMHDAVVKWNEENG